MHAGAFIHRSIIAAFQCRAPSRWFREMGHGMNSRSNSRELSRGKPGRPSIPLSTQNELWARAAGRCEFRGCNELVFLDRLTQKRSNISAISHIVAYSPEGPRGDAIRSKRLEKDIANLILT